MSKITLAVLTSILCKNSTYNIRQAEMQKYFYVTVQEVEDLGLLNESKRERSSGKFES